MSTAIIPHNPDCLAPAPGYRFLGIGELVRKTDHVHDYAKRWHTDAGCIYGQHVSSSWQVTIRRPICEDDPSAPPPEQWSVKGWVVHQASRTMPMMAVEGEEWWYAVSKVWAPSTAKCLYGAGLYVRRPVATPQAPKTAPTQIIVVNVGTSQVLSRAVQRVAFAAGWKWIPKGGAPTFNETPVTYYDNRPEGTCITLLPDGQLNYASLSYYQRHAQDALFLDARTDMGKLIDLLTAPLVPKAPVPVAPTVNGYQGVYIKGAARILFGCANIDIQMLRAAASLFCPAATGNRYPVSIGLDSGVVLKDTDVRAILTYIDEVNKATP